jgi:hypothetical protein
VIIAGGARAAGTGKGRRWPVEVAEGAVMNPRLRGPGWLGFVPRLSADREPFRLGAAGVVGQHQFAKARCQFNEILECRGQGEYASY